MESLHSWCVQVEMLINIPICLYKFMFNTPCYLAVPDSDIKVYVYWKLDRSTICLCVGGNWWRNWNFELPRYTIIVIEWQEGVCMVVPDYDYATVNSWFDWFAVSPLSTVCLCFCHTHNIEAYLPFRRVAHSYICIGYFTSVQK